MIFPFGPGVWQQFFRQGKNVGQGCPEFGKARVTQIAWWSLFFGESLTYVPLGRPDSLDLPTVDDPGRRDGWLVP